MYQGIDNVGVAVTDLNDALSFYERLEFEVERYSDTDARVSPAEAGYLYVFETTADEPVKRDEDLFENPAGIDHVSVKVDDVDVTYERLTAAGVEFFQEPVTNESWGIRTAGTHDPSGNSIYFIAYV